MLHTEREQRHPQAAQQRAHVLAAEEGALIDGEGSRLAVDLGLEADEIGRIAGRDCIIIRRRKVEVGQRKGHRQRDRVGTLIEEFVADRDRLGRDRQILRFDRDVGGFGEYEAANREFGGSISRGGWQRSHAQHDERERTGPT